jgi:ketosteroid isomerase-like protein
VLILVVVAVGVMALADLGPFADETEADRARDSVERFFDAYEGRDFDTVCTLFSADVRRQIEQVGATATKKGEPRGCPEVLTARLGTKPAKGTDVKIDSVRVSGNRAVADLEVKASGTRARSESLELQLERDTWVIASPQITQ